MPNAESLKILLTKLPFSDNGERWLRVSVTLLLALLVARAAADLTWQFTASLFDKTGRPAVTTLAVPPPPTGSRKVQTPSHPVEEIALFGQTLGTIADSEPLPAEDAPVTTLNLILKGVIAAQPMSRALAIIADKSGGNEQLYGLGEQIPGNAIISEIYADRVIISRGGVLETLLLEGSQPPSATAQPAAARAANSSANISALGDGNSWRIKQDYWEKRLADLPGLAREIGVEIYKENNQQRGYRLISAQGSRLLTSLGLQPGDILLSVNGRAMTTVQDGLAAYQQIRNGGRVQIEIKRNGRLERKTYNIDG
jgi:general secretion pathway protein C